MIFSVLTYGMAIDRFAMGHIISIGRDFQDFDPIGHDMCEVSVDFAVISRSPHVTEASLSRATVAVDLFFRD